MEASLLDFQGHYRLLDHLSESPLQIVLENSRGIIFVIGDELLGDETAECYPLLTQLPSGGYLFESSDGLKPSGDPLLTVAEPIHLFHRSLFFIIRDQEQ